MSLKDFLKHPKTRRILAVEWLILVSFVCVSAAIALFVEMPKKLDVYWEDWSAKQYETILDSIQSKDKAISFAVDPIIKKFGLKPQEQAAEMQGPPALPEAAAAPAGATPISEVTRPVDLFEILATSRRIEQLSNALLKAHEAGNTEDAKVFAKEIIRLRQEQPVAKTEPTTTPEAASAKKSRRSTADTFKALWFALSESFATASLMGCFFGVLGYLAAWFPRFTFRAIRVVLANRPPP
jgi:hypothetical protein